MGIILRSRLLLVVKYAAMIMILLIQLTSLGLATWICGCLLSGQIDGNPRIEAIIPEDISGFRSSEELYASIGWAFGDYLSVSSKRLETKV